MDPWKPPFPFTQLKMPKPVEHYVLDLGFWDLCRYAISTRRVWWFTATARTRARFARTMIGSFWLGLSNLLSVFVLALVYGTVFRVPNFKDYVLYLGFGLVLWNSLATAIATAPNLFEQQSQLLKNTNLHPIFYTLEEWSFQLQTFLQSFFLVAIVLSLLNISIWFNVLTAAFLPLVNFAIALYWLPVFVCVTGARYRDLYQLVPIALQLVFLISPILYYSKSLGSYAWVQNFNVLYLVIALVRDALLYGAVELQANLIVLFVNVLGTLSAIYILNKRRWELPFMV